MFLHDYTLVYEISTVRTLALRTTCHCAHLQAPDPPPPTHTHDVYLNIQTEPSSGFFCKYMYS